MKKRIKQVSAFIATLIFSCLIAVPVFGLTESEVQTQVDANGTGAVTGNLFIWFLCAVAFLKVSQKIDSFMSSLGINVGHTGGSMLAEAMIAMRGVVTAKQFTNGFGHYSKGSTGSDSGSFMSGGLSGIVSRGITNNAVKNVTGNSDNGLGGKMYNSSVNKGGSFANTVISKVANGDIKSTGSITGKGAESALMSYMGYTALGTDAKDIPSFSDVEIGGGRITATEKSEEHPDGIKMGMYNAKQYCAPSGEHSTVTTADGATWYKQYAQNSVERKPYNTPDGTVAYNESIVKKLPDPPRRKDRV